MPKRLWVLWIFLFSTYGSSAPTGNMSDCAANYASAAYEAPLETRVVFDPANPRSLEPLLGATNNRKLQRFISGIDPTQGREPSPLTRSPALLFSTKDPFDSGVWFSEVFGKPQSRAFHIGYFFDGPGNRWTPKANEKFMAYALSNGSIFIDSSATYALNHNTPAKEFHGAFVASEENEVRFYEREIQELRDKGYRKVAIDMPNTSGSKTPVVVWIPREPPG